MNAQTSAVAAEPAGRQIGVTRSAIDEMDSPLEVATWLLTATQMAISSNETGMDPDQKNALHHITCEAGDGVKQVFALWHQREVLLSAGRRVRLLHDDYSGLARWKAGDIVEVS